MSQELKCPICGQPTRIYMGNARKDLLCAKHAEALKAGKIEINDKGLFVDKETGKVLNMDYVEPKKEEKKQEGVVKCIACGKETKPGFLFCGSCYKKYADKKLLVEITNCRDITILDDSYEGNHVYRGCAKARAMHDGPQIRHICVRCRQAHTLICPNIFNNHS